MKNIIRALAPLGVLALALSVGFSRDIAAQQPPPPANPFLGTKEAGFLASPRVSWSVEADPHSSTV